MKTEISRISYQKAKRYSGVFQQQGRVLLDADINEQVLVQRGRIEQALDKVVASGVPNHEGVRLEQPVQGQPPRFKPGLVFADGVLAEVVPNVEDWEAGQQFGLDQQADLRLPLEQLPDAVPYSLVADVWHRTINALEDPTLLDPALNGADTCTRVRAVGQIKALDDEAMEVLVRRGNARLSIQVRDSYQSDDPCDPCAGEVRPEGSLGNYLFRVEVHEVRGQAYAPTELVLKWSTENGAEVRKRDQIEPTYKTNRHVYEFFNLDHEQSLGLPSHGRDPGNRGRLHIGFPNVEPDTDTFPMVRRWDGYLRIKKEGGNWTLALDQDGKGDGWCGTKRPATDLAADALGLVTLGNHLKIHLETLILELELDRHFLVGDFWNAAVREAVHQAGSSVLDKAETIGHDHHYLVLGRVDENGHLQQPDPAMLRRLNFPALTDIRAYDVGFEKPCNTSLYHDAEVHTVEDALRLLCHIEAEHVGFQADPDCPHLQGAQNVAEAINMLCKKPSGGGCSVTVGEEGRFPDIRSAVETLSAQGVRDIALCLLPGEHRLRTPWTLSPRQRGGTLRISGPGRGCRISAAGHWSIQGFESLWLSGFSLKFAEGGLNMVESPNVVIEDCEIDGSAQPTGLIHFHGSRFTFSRNNVTAKPRNTIPPMEIFNRINQLERLFASTQDPVTFVNLAEELLADFQAQSQAKRTDLMKSVELHLRNLAADLDQSEKLVYQNVVKEFAAPEFSLDTNIGLLSAVLFTNTMQSGIVAALDGTQPFSEFFGRKVYQPNVQAATEKAAKDFLKMSAAQRTATGKKMAQKAETMAAENRITPGAKDQIGQLATAIRTGTNQQELQRLLLAMQQQISIHIRPIHHGPSAALVLSNGIDEAQISENHIDGLLSLYGNASGAGFSEDEYGLLRSFISEGFGFRGAGNQGRICLTRNRLKVLKLGEQGFTQLRNFIKDQQLKLNGFFRQAILTGNTITEGNNLLVAEEIRLTDNFFETAVPPTFALTIMRVLGNSATFTGNGVAENRGTALIRTLCPRPAYNQPILNALNDISIVT